jgi:hypothetical protein
MIDAIRRITGARDANFAKMSKVKSRITKKNLEEMW